MFGESSEERAMGGSSEGGQTHDRLRSGMRVRECKRLSRDRRSSNQPVRLLSGSNDGRTTFGRSLLALASSLRCRHGIALVQPICHATKTQRTARGVSRETAVKSRVPFVSDKSVEKRATHGQNCSPRFRFWLGFAIGKSGLFWPFAATARNEVSRR